jgi:hypothetical protein
LRRGIANSASSTTSASPLTSTMRYALPGREPQVDVAAAALRDDVALLPAVDPHLRPAACRPASPSSRGSRSRGRRAPARCPPASRRSPGARGCPR